ncbi:MAG: hypothetical protein HKO57_12665, partial [Akkermansiaceae bacterium]|nr:hypothetical protein [Akkermansiaceae bacterium]
VIDSLQLMDGAEHCRIEVDGTLPVVAGAESQLRQVMENLISNAIKYRREEDPVVIIGAAREPGRWVIRVEDNGVGIRPEHQQRIFETLYRVASDNPVPGTGIGLGFAKGVIERHEGEIWVESERDRGSTFFFSLPANGSSAGDDAASPRDGGATTAS